MSPNTVAAMSRVFSLHTKGLCLDCDAFANWPSQSLWVLTVIMGSQFTVIMGSPFDSAPRLGNDAHRFETQSGFVFLNRALWTSQQLEDLD